MEEDNNLSKRIEEKMKARQERWKERQFCRQERRALRRGGFNFGRFLIGILVIFAGVFLLFQSFGILPESFNIDIFRFWPFLVIAIGLSLLDTRDRFSFAIGLIVFIAVLVMLTIIFWSSISFKGGNIRKPAIPVKVMQSDVRHPVYNIPDLRLQWNRRIDKSAF